MSKGKSVFVTMLVALMLAAILVGLYKLESIKAFMLIAGLLGGYGFVSASFSFCRWLRKEPPLLPAKAADNVKTYIPATTRRLRTDYQVIEDFPDEEPVHTELQGPVS